MHNPRIHIFIDPKDITVNTNHSDYAVTITHLPTGLKAEYNRYKSSHKNRIETMLMLKKMLYNLALSKPRHKGNSE